MSNCQRCGIELQSTSVLRKWCYDCRLIIQREQARERKRRYRREEKAQVATQTAADTTKEAIRVRHY